MNFLVTMGLLGIVSSINKFAQKIEEQNSINSGQSCENKSMKETFIFMGDNGNIQGMWETEQVNTSKKHETSEYDKVI